MAFEKGITEERDKLKLTGKAESEIGSYRIVIKGTDPDAVAQAADSYAFPIGVSENASENGKDSYENGDPVTVVYSGIAYLEMSGIGLRNDRVMATFDGKGLRHETDIDRWVFGTATQAWTDGQIIPVEIIKQFIPNPTPD